MGTSFLVFAYVILGKLCPFDKFNELLSITLFRSDQWRCLQTCKPCSKLPFNSSIPLQMQLLLCVFVVLFAASLLLLHVEGIPKSSLAKPASRYRGRGLHITANTGQPAAYPARSAFSTDYGPDDSSSERAPKDLVVYYTRNAKLRVLVAVISGTGRLSVGQSIQATSL